MKCIFCGYADSKVVDSRTTDEGETIRRRRECIACGKRFTTYETVETNPVLVIKNDGSRQPFDILKVKKGIIKACEKRPVSLSQIEDICEQLKTHISENDIKEIKSCDIGEFVMNKLKEIDDVSYVRFASVYKKFADIEFFKNFISSL